jgi:hypothetical protein
VEQNIHRNFEPDAKKNQNQTNNSEKGQKSTKPEQTISFEEFGNFTKVKTSTSPSNKNFNDFFFFN